MTEENGTTRARKLEYEQNLADGILTINVIDAGGIVCNITKLPGMAKVWKLMDDFQRQLFMHGVKQIIADKAAALSGKAAQIAMQEKWDALLTGDLRTRGVGGSSVVAQAAAKVWVVDPIAAAERLTKMKAAAEAPENASDAIKTACKKADKTLKAFFKSHSFKLEKSRVENARLEAVEKSMQSAA